MDRNSGEKRTPYLCREYDAAIYVRRIGPSGE